MRTVVAPVTNPSKTEKKSSREADKAKRNSFENIKWRLKEPTRLPSGLRRKFCF